MLTGLISATAVICIAGLLHSYFKFKDPFHPAVILLPMCMALYVVMPLQLMDQGTLFTYVRPDQAEWVQSIVIAGLVCLIVGLNAGSAVEVDRGRRRLMAACNQATLHKGAYILGSIGLLAWFYTIRNVGGITAAFGRSKGMGWSELGYIREAAYLMIVGVLLLISPQGFAPKKKLWLIAVVAFSTPYLLQGLLGAQRGPTFLIVMSLGVSWYLARGRRPSLMTLVGAGAGLGFLLLILVVNRGNIYLGSQQEVKTDVSSFFEGSEANEYIFGIGCMVAADQTDRYFWGKRYLAQVMVRPIPKQIWPNKYEDFGVPELLVNAGVAGNGLEAVMGWSSVPGAAAAMVADLWVECSWLCLPALFGIGYWYGSTWKKAVSFTGPYITQFMILLLLSIYMVSQGGEAVIFRLVILSLPSWFVWRKAMPGLSQG